MNVWLGALEQGFLFGAMVLGIYLTFWVLNYPDLTIDGSFTLGAAVAAKAILMGHDPWWGLAMALVCGAVAGLVTGLLHTQLKVTPLLSGILTMIGLYSVNLRIMGQANVSLLRRETIFTGIKGFIPDPWGTLLLAVLLFAAVFLAVYLFLCTELGMALRATGDNEQMIRSLGVNTDYTKLVGLALGNGLIAFSGSLVGQYQGFADIGMGIGMIVAGLASIIIGETLVGTQTLTRAMASAIIGSLIYRSIISLVLQLGLSPTDLKLFTSLMVVAALALPLVRNRLGFSPLRGAGDVKVTPRNQNF